jgi:hypothetical protein
LIFSGLSKITSHSIWGSYSVTEYRPEDYLESSTHKLRRAKEKIILIKSVDQSGREGTPHVSVGRTGRRDPKVQFKGGGRDPTTLDQLAMVPLVGTERGLLKPRSCSLVTDIGSCVIG